jgi:hypothetical protein
MAYKLLTTLSRMLKCTWKKYEKHVSDKKSIIFIIIINDNTM